MKQSLKLSLAISLALSAGQAFGLGLGQIQVKSRLNQPLEAEIPVMVDRRGEAESLVVKLASAEEFSRIGIERSQIGVPLEFALGQSARGETVIKVTSKEAVRAPFLDFLLEANWSNGRVLREYTVLLDPPLTAPASATSLLASEPARPAAAAIPPPVAPVAARAEPAIVTPPPAPVVKPASPPPPPAQPVAATPTVAKPAVAPAPRPVAPVERALPPSVAASNGSNYGPVAEGETLWEIAAATLPEDGANINQLMLALLKANPEAFVRNNINQLKRGAILRIPSGEEIRAVGSARAAAAQVQAQVADWRSGSARPTLLAGSAAGTVAGTDATSSTPRRVDDRLALVPPEMGKDGLASTGQAGSSAGAAGGNASVAELARANETLAARNQEASDLRNRVQDLEGLQSKNERLISLKDSEIAELQRKLASAQAASAEAAKSKAAPASAAVEPIANSAPAVPAADDIWGKTGTADAPATEPSAEVKPEGSIVADPKVETASSSPSSAASSADAVGTSPVVADSTSSTVADPAIAAAAVDSSNAPAPVDSTITSSSAPVDSAATAVPAEPAPVATTPVATPAAVVEEQPWYLNPLVLGGAGIVVLLAGFLASRSRRKATDPARPSLADQFAAAGPAGLIPVVAQEGDGAILGDEEAQLAEQIALRPDDLGARLELLSIYYADNRVGDFRAAAAEMQPYVDDPREPEWVQVRAMGEDLLPDDPLFVAAADRSSVASSAVVDTWSDADAAIDKTAAELRWSDADDVLDTVRNEPVAPVVSTLDQDFDNARYAPTPKPSVDAVSSKIDDFRDVDAEIAALDIDHKSAQGGGLELEFSLDDDFNDGFEPAPPVGPAVVAPVPVARALTEFVSEKKDDDAFGFDLPPLDFDMEFSKPQASEVTNAATVVEDAIDMDTDDEFFVGEDALGTKLDLARAYADMGDPDGARAMLEEVIAEGDASQKNQARKLLDELG